MSPYQPSADRQYEDNGPRPAGGGAIDPHRVVMAFSLVAPVPQSDRHQSLVRFRAIDSSKRNLAIIDREEGEA